MRWFSKLRLRLRSLIGRHQVEQELADELRFHVECQTERFIAAGISKEEARCAALREFGRLDQVKELCRDARGLRLIDDLGQDVRYALRTLFKNPGFAIVATLLLALTIGANTAIFSLIDAFLLRPLPVKDPHQLVLVQGAFPYSTFEQFRDRNRTFSGMFAYDETHFSVTINGQPEYVDGDFVSGEYFDVLGIRPAAGRTFRSDDDRADKPPVAVLSYRYWNRRFARDPAVIGQIIDIGKTPITIVGVTPSGLLGRKVAGNSADVMLPMFLQRRFGLKDHDSVMIMARLMPDIRLERAQADLDVISQRILTDSMGSPSSPRVHREIRAHRIELRPGLRGTSDGNGQLGTELPILAGVVGVALLIACVNVANLLLARADGRRKEIAVRIAIGASRTRLVRQLLTESTVLVLGGAGLGLLVAKGGVGLLLTVLSYGQAPIPFDLALNARLLTFAGAVSLLTGILFGLAPALTMTRVDLTPSLKGHEGGAASQPARRRSLNVLVVSQVSLSFVLLIGSGLMIRSLSALYQTDLGYERENVIVAWILPVLAAYDRTKEITLYGEVPEKLKALPGVRSVSVSRLRMARGGWFRNVWVQSSASDESRKVYCDAIGPHFFETMGIEVLRGRELIPADTETAPRVAVISESMVRRFFPNLNPIGGHLGFGGPQTAGEISVVGVVRDVRHRLLEEQPLESVYVPYTQAPPDQLGQMNIVVRTAANPTATIAAMRRELQLVDANLPLVDVQTQAAEVDDYLGGHRSLATLLTIFGGLGLVMTSIGLYGTMSVAVGRRTKELGIRMALGAGRQDVLWMVLRQALTPVLMGVLIGIPVAAIVTRLISSMLFAVQRTDAKTMSLAILAMFGTALVAGSVPARRATRVDPMVALRDS
jgi:predicted permease